jgi:ectoine hydroxylase-related dioxygenase (phytanoyl-CoA dioxygenase family)
MNEFRVSNDLLLDSEGLRLRADEEGYLFFRGLLETDAVRQVRRDILNLCGEAGWLEPGSDPEDGIARPGVAWIEPQPEYMAVYNRVMRLESFHALAHQPALLGMFNTLFGEPTLVHARNIARIVFPNNALHTTPAHQDYVHIQGTTETWTAWIPLGDCPRDLGSLAVLRGSHRQGVYPARAAYGAGGLGIDTESLPFEWVSADFRAGDVVLFHSLTVHKALPNLSPNRIRLSADFRYQPESQPVTQSSFQPHYAQVTWDDVYRDWKSTAHQYYWQGKALTWADFTRKYHEAAGLGERVSEQEAREEEGR